MVGRNKDIGLDGERTCHMKSIHCPKWMRLQQRNNRDQNVRCDLADVDICQIRHRVTLQFSVIRFGEFFSRTRRDNVEISSGTRSGI